jgi:glycosyltransferase involved in cell wall biosynthesis
MTTVLEPRTRTTAPNERDVRDTTPHRVAYVVSHYPLVSHVFVQREVRALRALGADVTVFSIHRAGPEEVLSTADAEEAAATHALLPIDVGQLTGAHRRAFLRSPRSYLATLRYALRRSPRGARAKLWQLFYFAEAIAVWDGCVKLGIRHLHAHFANVAADVAWLATDFGRRSEPDRPWHWSFTMHGCVEFWDVDRFNLARKAAAASMVLCISDFTRAQLMALTEPQYWPKLEVVHCGVDLDQYSPSTRPDRDGRPVELLTVGRLSPEKGLLVLLEAVAQLHRDGVGVRLTIVGDGPLRDELFAYAAEAGIDGIVTFAGSVGQDDMPSYFDAADVFCQPSFNEGIPVVLMEAMASGLPVVGSAVGAIAELVADRHSGLLVTAARAGALADALRHLVESPQLRATMGTRGREIVERDFDTAALARRIDRLFRELADGARMVPPEREPGPTTRLW